MNTYKVIETCNNDKTDLNGKVLTAQLISDLGWAVSCIECPDSCEDTLENLNADFRGIYVFGIVL